MKRFLIGIVMFAVIVFGGLKIFTAMNYGGTAYYTKVTTVGTKIAPQDAKGNVYVDYRYAQTGYAASGAAKKLVFNANKARPLRLGAYLKLTYNANKGVTSWEAVPASKVPQPAKQRLE
ncbi:YxeA family protein [Lacticaseibacillus sp. GG6-2]